MATIRQRNNAYSVIYKFTDENGETRQKWESFKTMADAKARKKEVEYKESIGTFVVPTCKTVNELLTEYVELYGKSKWALSTYESNVRMIENYVRPTIGSMKLTEINTHALERYYQSLLKMPAVANNARKPKKRNVSPHTVRDIHKILRSSFGQAKKWGLMERNPADGAMLPKYESKKREIWTAETLFEALKLCDDPRLVLALNLSFCCSLRIGELLGLTWDCIDITHDSIDAGTASVIVDKELQRVNRAALMALEQKDVRLAFPVQSAKAKTVMVLKKPKTESSIRKVYMPKAVANMLAAWKERQDEEKEILCDEYRDYALVFAGPTGYVDLVIPEENWQQKRSDMHEYHIDTFVMGDDWVGKFDFLKEEGVEVVYLPRTPEISSSQIKKDLYDANAVDGESKLSHDDINTNPQ